jgi:hypothetical protein
MIAALVTLLRAERRNRAEGAEVAEVSTRAKAA